MLIIEEATIVTLLFTSYINLEVGKLKKNKFDVLEKFFNIFSN